VVVLLGYLAWITRSTPGGSRLLPSDARAVLRYNLKIYVLTVPTLAYEPLVKALLNVFAGLSAVAYYEIANRLLQQVNAIVLAANQAIVPLVAVRAATGRLLVDQAFTRTVRLVTSLTVLAFAGALVCLPLVQRFVFGPGVTAVVGYGAILALGWVANALCGPAYFIGVTVDNFLVNVTTNYLILVVIGVGGPLLGNVSGGAGLAVSVAAGFVAASTIVNVQFVRAYHVDAAHIIPVRQRWFGFAAVLLVVATTVLTWSADLARLVAVTSAALLALAVLGWAMARHHRNELATRTGEA
jgi:O-antigen/teichoic acid export membrane protein